MHQNPEIFLHVGLGKAASTYLQYKVFPELKGIYYIQRTRYRKAPQIIKNTGKKKYLASREFDRQFAKEVKKFSSIYPNTKAILVLRRHDSWIASQYRRYVKNGGHHPFEVFFDPEKNNGLWKKEELLFFPKIKLLEEEFNEKPLVLFHEDLKNDPHRFIGQIVRFTGTHYDPGKISLTSSHSSYNDKQLKVMRRVGKYLFRKKRKEFDTPLLHWLQVRSRLLLCYAILYPAWLLPPNVTGNETLIPSHQLEKIRQEFSGDWKACKSYAG